MPNSMSSFVYEVIMDEFPEWAGNELYTTFDFAKFCAAQDYDDTFYSRWKAGYEDAEEPGEYTWEFISKNLFHMYEDDSPTGVSLKIRHVNSLTGE